MDQITLFLTANGWIAKHSGNLGEEVFSLFGSYTLPTAFTSAASPDTVIAAIARLNPDVLVILGRSL